MDAHLIVDNIDVVGSCGRSFVRVDPISGATATRAVAASVADATAAVDSCARALPLWGATGPHRKREILLEAASLLVSSTGALVERMESETGAAKSRLHFNVKLSATILREAAAITTQVQGEVIPVDKPGMFSMALRRPAGVVLSIAPWNAPLVLAARGFATALACGNTVVLKASELCPGSQFLLCDVMRRAGLPAGVLNFITNAPEDAAEIVEALIAHPAVRRVNFTGSTRTGRLVAQTAARYLKPVLLELGGKAPLIVLKDADIGAAVRAAAYGAFIHQGQLCMSTERIVVDESVADDFSAQLGTKARTLAVGNPREQDVALGSMISVQAAERVSALIDDAMTKGATLVAGGKRVGSYVEATVLDDVDRSMKLFYEESFGPVVCIVRVADAQEAVDTANDNEYGLSSSIFTRDISLALTLAARLDFGCCHINGPTIYDEPQMPLGGRKASGYGRFGGRPGIDEFTEVQWVSIQDPNQPYPI